MLSYYAKRSKNEGFTRVKTFHEYTTWIHGDTVTQQELDELAKTHNLQSNILRDVRDKNELPHIEYGKDGTVYAFLRVPLLREDHEVVTTPLLLILTKSRFFTLGYGSTFSPDDEAGARRPGHGRPCRGYPPQAKVPRSPRQTTKNSCQPFREQPFAEVSQRRSAKAAAERRRGIFLSRQKSQSITLGMSTDRTDATGREKTGR